MRDNVNARMTDAQSGIPDFRECAESAKHKYKGYMRSLNDAGKN